MQAMCQVSTNHKYALALKVLLLMALILLSRQPASADNPTGNPISLEITNQPLSLVLDRLSQLTGKRLIYDENWADTNISVKIVNQDLDKALRRILNNYNYGIIYRDDGNIRIMIYGEKDTTTSETIDSRSPVEYGHVGSADIQVEENAPEDETEPGVSDDSEVDREEKPEEDQKSVEDDPQAVAESSETDTKETVDDDKDNEPSQTLPTE